MLEVLLGLLLAVVLATLVFRATGASAYSFGRLRDELQLQEAKRHILTQLEKIICYDAQRVIRLQENGQITCTLIEKAISINHKSQEKPVTMQVAGFFYTSAIMSKVSTAHGKSTAYVTGM